MEIDTEGAASIDDLDTISGASEGDIVIIKTAASARDVVVKHATGNITNRTGTDITLSDSADRLTLMFDGSNWQTISRSINNDFLSSKSTNSYTYLPNGIILQWGRVVLTSNSSSTESLPVTYPNAQLCGLATIGTNSAGVESPAHVVLTSTSQIEITNAHAGTVEIFWQSVGH